LRESLFLQRVIAKRMRWNSPTLTKKYFREKNVISYSYFILPLAAEQSDTANKLCTRRQISSRERGFSTKST
jgi:hypothetical protein